MSSRETPPSRAEGARVEDGSAPRLAVGRVVLGAVLLLVGLLWLLDAAGVADLRWRIVLPATLTVVGVALLFTARRGAHDGLVSVGVVLTVLVLVSGAGPVGALGGGLGERTERPTSSDRAETGYDLGVGSLVVDLREVEDLRDGLTVPLSVGIGELVVVLPDDVGARVEASAGIGEVSVLDVSHGGLGVSAREDVDGEPTVVLELSVGIGQVEVRR